MGSKHKDKKKKHQHNPDPQLDLDQSQQDNDDTNNIVETETKKIKNKKKKETLDVKIQTVHTDPDKISPLVGYFPTSFDPFKDSGDSSEVNVYQNVKRSNRFQVVVKPRGSEVNFVGTNYSGEAAAPQLCTYALGVLDKDTQTLKIVPITSNKIFRLEPNFGGSDTTQDEAQEIPKEEVNNEERFQQRRLLDRMYSTKKTDTRNKKMDSLRQKQDPRSEQDLEKSLEDVKVNTEALDAGRTNARNIPFHDMSASAPEKAYPLEKIIEKGEWDYLSDLFNITQGAEVTPDSYPIFVCNRVHKLKDIKDEYEKGTVACVLQYITHLIKYKDKHSMDHFRKVKNHKFPSILEEKFRTMFEPSSQRLSSEKNTFLINHVLVLTLFVDGFRSDISDIAKDLKIGVVELRKHWLELGCKLVREKNTLFATLPVPLTFPVNRQKRRKR
ncbi:DNA-directed RNA polymerase I subunit rpa49 [Heracleum sosnowskyi]|uniref:DNA-directed RNA polymerase I subunit rpa49 n=1 Tax=Heracleum sosnowskyi TaxID=360622 RepID=A0AAD8M7Q9_9APIA|nr:DNA-directed RNA polymerase I subunit rpa49 [Heracleum sosnowskyi]